MLIPQRLEATCRTTFEGDWRAWNAPLRGHARGSSKSALTIGSGQKALHFPGRISRNSDPTSQGLMLVHGMRVGTDGPVARDVRRHRPIPPIPLFPENSGKTVRAAGKNCRWTLTIAEIVSVVRIAQRWCVCSSRRQTRWHDRSRPTRRLQPSLDSSSCSAPPHKLTS